MKTKIVSIFVMTLLIFIVFPAREMFIDTENDEINNSIANSTKTLSFPLLN